MSLRFSEPNIHLTVSFALCWPGDHLSKCGRAAGAAGLPPSETLSDRKQDEQYRVSP